MKFNQLSFHVAQLSEVTASEAALKADLAKVRDERAAQKRRQNALDRELARLLAQHRKLTEQLANERSRQHRERSLSGSNQGGGSEVCVREGTCSHVYFVTSLFPMPCIEPRANSSSANPFVPS